MQTVLFNHSFNLCKHNSSKGFRCININSAGMCQYVFNFEYVRSPPPRTFIRSQQP